MAHNEDANGTALLVEGSSRLEGNAEVTGATNIGDDLTVNGDTAIDNGTLTVNTNGAAVNIDQGRLNIISDALGEGFIDLGIGGVNNAPRLNFLGATPGNGGARIDAYMNDGGEADPDEWELMALHLNTDEGTRDVVISHRDRLDPFPKGTVRLESPRVQVGSPRDVEGPPQPGQIDGSGTAAEPVDLLIGTRDVSQNVLLSRLLQTIICNERIRITTDALGNANVILNGQQAQNIDDPLARGYADNPNGHPEWGGQGASIDFITNGQVRFWIDDLGGHNRP